MPLLYLFGRTPKTPKTPRTPKTPKTPKPPKIVEEEEQQRSPSRKRLNAALRTALAHVTHTTNSVKNRIRFSKSMGQFIQKAQASCLKWENKRLFLPDKNGNPLIVFDKKIGSPSVYGIAHLHSGQGFYAAHKFATKIMRDTEDHRREVHILKAMTDEVFRGYTPNFPVTYSAAICRDPITNSRNNNCPAVVKSPYLLVINEIAQSDLQAWMQTKRQNTEYQSVFAQIFLAVYAFQRMGYCHNDAHLGNFLIHQVTPGGYWRYAIPNFKDPSKPSYVYVENTGWLLVLWDPGLAKTWNHKKWGNDFVRPMNLIATMSESAHYARMGMVPPPRDIADVLYEASVFPEIVHWSGKYKNRDELLRALAIKTFSMFSKDFKPVVKLTASRDKAPGTLLNVRPYLLRDGEQRLGNVGNYLKYNKNT